MSEKTGKEKKTCGARALLKRGKRKAITLSENELPTNGWTIKGKLFPYAAKKGEKNMTCFETRPARRGHAPC